MIYLHVITLAWEILQEFKKIVWSPCVLCIDVEKIAIQMTKTWRDGGFDFYLL